MCSPGNTGGIPEFADFYSKAKIEAARAEEHSLKGRYDVAVHNIEEAVRLVNLVKEKTISEGGKVLNNLEYDLKSYEALTHYYKAQQFVDEGRYFLGRKEALKSYSRLRLLKGQYKRGLLGKRLERAKELMDEAEKKFRTCEPSCQDLQDQLEYAISRENYERAKAIKEQLAGM